MKLPPFEYHRPATLSEAVALLASYEGEAKIVAGGQSLIPMMAFRLVQPRALIDIGAIPGLGLIGISASGLRLGSRVRWVDIERHSTLLSAHPLLVRAVSHIAHYQVRNRGTAGGSLAHADPAAEFPAVCLACAAELEVVGRQGRRSISAGHFFHGALTTDLADDEVIDTVIFPPWAAGRRWSFREFARRPGDFAIAGIVLCYDLDELGRAVDPRVAAFGTSDTPLRLAEVESLLEGRMPSPAVSRRARQIAQRVVPADSDPHAPAAYRQALVGVLLERAIAESLGQRGESVYA